MSARPLRQRMRVAATIIAIPFRASAGMAWAILASAVVAGVAGAVMPLGAARLVNGVVDQDSSLIRGGAAILAVSIAATFIAGAVAQMSSLKLAGHASLYVRSRIADLAARAPRIEHFERPDYLRELELLQLGAWELSNGPRDLMMVTQLGIRLTISIALLATISPYLISIVLVAGVPILTSRTAVRRRELTAEQTAEHRRLANELFQLATTTAPARELRIYGLKAEIQARHHDIAEQVTREITHTSTISTLITAAGWATYGLAFATAVVLVTLGAAHGAATVGAVVLTMEIGRQATGQIGGISDSTSQLLVAGRTTQRLLWLDDYTRTELAKSGSLPPPQRIVHGIRFDDVCFTYPGTDKAVLQHVNMQLDAGSTVAIVGANGAGKTTFVKLISGLYRPTSGRITVDGTDLTELSLATWRARLAGGFQDFIRPELHAHQAVGLGDLPRIDDRAAVAVALERASGSDVIERLPDGLDTPLGRSFGGADLSIGQWQKLALGRALMRDDPLVIVFDEPTASLDATTEHALFERFSETSQVSRNRGTITLLISHRFSTVQMADRILVMADGTIVEDGTHAELMRKNGTYASMYETQAQAYR